MPGSFDLDGLKICSGWQPLIQARDDGQVPLSSFFKYHLPQSFPPVLFTSVFCISKMVAVEWSTHVSVTQLTLLFAIPLSPFVIVQQQPLLLELFLEELEQQLG